MLQPELISVKATEASKLLLEYENGELKIFDVKPYITGTWFGELSDENYFRTVHLTADGKGIEWENGQDIAPHELYDESLPMCRRTEEPPEKRLKCQEKTI